MIFPNPVLRWAPLVRQEIANGGYPFPPEYVLAVCQVESRGHPGAVNKNSGASGLMQVMPVTLQGYNKNNSPSISLSTLRSKSESAAPEQFRVGMWVMGRYLKLGYNWISETNPNPALSDLIKVSDLMYGAGPGRIRSKFGKLSDRKFDSLVASDPDWQPFAHPRKVWKWTAEKNNPSWDMEAIDQWVSETTETPPITPPDIAGAANGLLGALLILSLASWYMSSRR